MDKRNFIKTLSLATLASPLYSGALIDILKTTTPDKLATLDEFWSKIRADYNLKPDYINLESGYYNIIPTTTMNKLIDHIQKVNYEGSYYMRTIQWENKKRMTEKLANVIK